MTTITFSLNYDPFTKMQNETRVKHTETAREKKNLQKQIHKILKSKIIIKTTGS